MPCRLLASTAVALVLALTGLLAVGHGQSLTGEYKVGVLEPLTGPLASEGKRHLEGYEIVRDMINERGGVMGKKLVFAVADAPDPTAAATEANRLITREGVKIITGTFSSRLCGAASEAAARHNVIYWETSCVDPRFNKRGLKNVFRTEIDATGFGWYNIEFIAKHLAPRFNLRPNQLKIAFLSEDSSYGQGVTEAARQRAKGEFGMQELGAEYYSFTAINDFTPIIVKFKQLNPDIVHHIGYTNDAPLFWRQAREQNFLFKALVHAGATGYGSPDFGKALGSDANGVFALLEPGPGFRMEALRPEGQKLEREFREAVQKKTGSYPLGGHQLAGGGLWVLKLVLDRAKSDDIEKFRSAVMSLDMPVGSSINGWGVKFAENGQNANERVQHYMLQWQGGQLVTVWPEEFSTLRAKWIPLGSWDQRK
ncbi:MAG TPA: ABC transporter substrate-binding protein [Methylomirabilota bacterium]|jgi:branched-chain amino acid transport system substrate-binding protein|nr:ABC transporter substrate-binding protein [Methylomirabilota bacterium]